MSNDPGITNTTIFILQPGNEFVIQPAGTNARIKITVPLDHNPTLEVESDRVCEHYMFDSWLIQQPVEELDQS